MIKINIGGGKDWHQESWTNLDIENGFDINEKLLSPYENNSVDTIFTSHCLEHLEFNNVALVINDCYRVLKPNGVLRIIVPDIEILNSILEFNDYSILINKNPHYYARDGQRDIPLKEHISSLVGWDYLITKGQTGFHKCALHFSVLKAFLMLSGFSSIAKVDKHYSLVNEMTQPSVLDKSGMPTSGFNNPNTDFISLYIESVK